MNQPIRPLNPDFSAFSRDISDEELRDWYRAKAGRVPFFRAGAIFGTLFWAAVTVGAVYATISALKEPDASKWFLLIPVIPALSTFFLGRSIFTAKLPDAPMRSEEFFAVNGIKPQYDVKRHSHRPALFTIGTDREISARITGDEPRFYELGNYQYSMRTGNGRTTYYWGYMVFPLNKSVPWILLDALHGAARIKVSTSLKHQDKRLHVHMMGELWEWYELYCGPSSEEFAKKFFTTDVLAALRHSTDSSFSAEFIDDRLYLYTRGVIANAVESTWRGNYQRINVISAKLAELGL